MLIRNTKEFLKLTKEKKIIALDIGKKKIGVAISNEKKNLTIPLSVIAKEKLQEELINMLKELSPGGILIGLPINPSIKNSRTQQMIQDITKNIDMYLTKNNYELPILFWDESYTSLEAEELTNNFFKNKKEQKKYIDKFAAKIILDDFFREKLNK